MNFKIIDGHGNSNSTGVHNVVGPENLIIPLDIQVHIDAILKDPNNVVEYVMNLPQSVREQVVGVFQQVYKLLQGK